MSIPSLFQMVIRNRLFSFKVIHIPSIYFKSNGFPPFDPETDSFHFSDCSPSHYITAEEIYSNRMEMFIYHPTPGFFHLNLKQTKLIERDDRSTKQNRNKFILLCHNIYFPHSARIRLICPVPYYIYLKRESARHESHISNYKPTDHPYLDKQCDFIKSNIQDPESKFWEFEAVMRELAHVLIPKWSRQNSRELDSIIDTDIEGPDIIPFMIWEFKDDKYFMDMVTNIPAAEEPKLKWINKQEDRIKMDWRLLAKTYKSIPMKRGKKRKRD